MTEEQRQRLVQAKEDVSARLSALSLRPYRLGVIDRRLSSYVKEVIGRPAAHNLFEQLAVERFLTMFDRYGVNITEVHRFFSLYESLYFPGKRGWCRYALTPVQTFQFASIYGFWEGGRRVVREALLFVPRKFSKTTSSAALVIDDLLYGDSNAEAYTGANSQDQAKKCFDVIRGCMQRLDPDGRRYRVNEMMIKSLRPDRSSLAQCLTANARTKDGLNASTVIMDEFSQARDADLLNVLTTSMGVRDNPLTAIITTASDVFDGPFYEMLQGYKSLLLGDYEDDSVFAHIFEPDLGDPEDSEATWRKVQPHMGVTVSVDSYREQYAKALRNGAEGMLAFRTKLLNLYTENQQRSWISSTTARSMARRMRIEDLRDHPIATIGVDLSVRDDFSAVSVAWYDKGQKVINYHTSYFFPEGALADHPNEKLYRAWAERGHLRLLPGDVIDYAAIANYIMSLKKYIYVVGVGYDPYKSRDFVNILSTVGYREVLRPVRQTLGTFTSPVESFEHGVYTGKVFINDNPINFYCFGNAVLRRDDLDNVKPEKRTPTGKIDGVITMLMCTWLFEQLER